MNELLDVTKAIADGTRVRVLQALRRRELCACQITELLGLAPSTVSKHLAILKQARLVDSRKDGRWVHYRRAGTDAPRTALDALVWLDQALLRDPQIREDSRRLRTILEIPVEKLCSLQGRT
jgi:DNA-binding transcriptional ArsR family regulator